MMVDTITILDMDQCGTQNEVMELQVCASDPDPQAQLILCLILMDPQQ